MKSAGCKVFHGRTLGKIDAGVNDGMIWSFYSDVQTDRIRTFRVENKILHMQRISDNSKNTSRMKSFYCT